jgi:hypothetical protein
MGCGRYVAGDAAEGYYISSPRSFGKDDEHGHEGQEHSANPRRNCAHLGGATAGAPVARGAGGISGPWNRYCGIHERPAGNFSFHATQGAKQYGHEVNRRTGSRRATAAPAADPKAAEKAKKEAEAAAKKEAAEKAKKEAAEKKAAEKAAADAKKLADKAAKKKAADLTGNYIADGQALKVKTTEELGMHEDSVRTKVLAAVMASKAKNGVDYAKLEAVAGDKTRGAVAYLIKKGFLKKVAATA